MRYALTITFALALAVGAACGKNDTQAQSPPSAEKVAPSEPGAADPADPTPAEPGAAAAGEAAAPAKAEIGQAAPDFILKDIDGKEFKLSDHKGKTVVLEWYNSGCPFVVYAYEDGPLKDMAKTAAEAGVVWLNVNSGAPGKQGHGDEANRSSKAKWGFAHPILIDEDGTVGRAYEAKTTPHMYIVNPDGVLVYRGGLDNAPMGRVKGGGEAINYVANALADLAAGRAVATPESEPYGCSVKY